MASEKKAPERLFSQATAVVLQVQQRFKSGKLLVDNKLGGNINVQAQGLLGGNGTIGGDVNVADGGTIAPEEMSAVYRLVEI